MYNFARYLGRTPDTATVEDLRNYQLQLVDCGTLPPSLNAYGANAGTLLSVKSGYPREATQPKKMTDDASCTPNVTDKDTNDL